MFGLHPAFLLALAACGAEGRVVELLADELPAVGVERLHVDVGAGSLDVIGAPGRDTVEVEVTVRSRGWNPPADDHVLQLMAFRLEEGPEARLRVDLPDGFPEYVADVVVRIPEGLPVSVEDGSGDARLRGTGPLEVVDDSGDLLIEGVVGDVTVRDDAGGVVLRDVLGRVTVRDDAGDVLIERVEGDVDVRDDAGDLVVRDVTGVVTVRDDAGHILLERVGAHRILADDGGGVEIR